MVGDPEVQGALDQTLTLQLAKDIEERAVFPFLPAEGVAELGLADVKAGAVDAGEDLLLELRGDGGLVGGEGYGAHRCSWHRSRNRAKER